jgi:hypothetical protein
MGIATGRPIGFTTTPLTPASKSSFWTQNVTKANSHDYANDSLALSCLIGGNKVQQNAEVRIALSLDGGEIRTGDAASPVAAIEDVEDRLSLNDLSSAKKAMKRSQKSYTKPITIKQSS